MVWPWRRSAPPTTNPVGSCGAIPGFACADYTVGLSNDFFVMPSRVECPPGEVLVTGINRATGKVKCLMTPATACPDGSIAHGVRAVTDTTGTHLEMACHRLAEAVCPDQYVFESLKVAQLDFGKTWQGDYSGHPAPVGQCRYRWRNMIGWQTPLPHQETTTSTTATATVCNPVIYTAVVDQPCGAGTSDDNPGLCGNNTQPHSDVAVSGHVDTNAAVASCSVTVSNSCNSTITAWPTASGRCQVRASPIHLPPHWP